jgi:1,6-anhydro-N-acetylmuramate kinase
MVHETSLDPSKRPHIHAQLGHLVSAVIEAFLKNHNISNASIDLIGSRNQPARLSSAPEQVEVPLEECSKQETIIATQTGITTVTDLRRWADQYSTGHDAHVVQNEGVLLRQATNLRACQNIGPVATLSLLSSQRGNNTHAILDWNCGVGTMFIDAAMRYYTRGQLDNDNDGEWGAQGSVNQCVVDRTLENNKYINDLNQQSTGRETPVDNEAQALIEECLFLGMSNYDTIATITRITAQNIATQYRDVMLKYLTADQKIDEIVVCGPGARNKNIISFLRSELSDTTIRATDYLGISSLSASEEAVSIAQQAFDAILATRPGAEPSQAFEQGLATAKIAPGERWTQLVEQTMRFGQGNPRPNPHRVGVDEVSEIRSSLQDCKL